MKRLHLAIISFLIVLFASSQAIATVGVGEINSIVRIHIIESETDEFYSYGSGVIIDNDGHILTNAHVVTDVFNSSDYYPLVCLTYNEKYPPLCGYVVVEPLWINEEVDLALLKIVEVYDVESETYLTIEDHQEKNESFFNHIHFDREQYLDEGVSIGDELQILGYPYTGENTITLTKGSVSGFETLVIEDEVYPYAIKTDASITSGNSGGGAFDTNNNFVGIPNSGYDGSIGYIISLPIINYFLDETLGEDYVPRQAYDLSCGENETLGEDNLCYCDEGFVYSTTELMCVPPTQLCTELFGENVFGNSTGCHCEAGYDWNDEETACIEDSSSTPNTTSFVDVGSSHKNSEAIAYLKDEHIVDGYPDGTFNPDGSINRAEILKILVGGTGITPNLTDYNRCFPDVNVEWFAPYVCYAKSQGWIEGYPDGTFKPAQNINKVEALKMLLNSQNMTIFDNIQGYIFDDVSTDAWYATYVKKAKDLNLLEEAETSTVYNPGANMTRGGMSEVLFRLLTL